MHWRAIFRGLLLAGAIGALGAVLFVAFVLLKHELNPPAWLVGGPDPVASAVRPGAKPGLNFTLHETPRPLPEFPFMDGEARPVSLADFKGRIILLNIWATWCGPCRREMPSLDRLQKELGGPDFQVLALSIDRMGLAAVKPFYEELGLQALAIYIDASANAKFELAIAGLPTTLLIDRQGRELGRRVGPAEWDSPEMIVFLRQRIKLANSPASR